MKHKDTKAQRHKEGRASNDFFGAAFFVSLCLCVFAPLCLCVSSLVHAKAAVNTKLGARDVTGAVGCEKDDTVRNFFHCSPAPGNDTPIAARFAQKLGLRFALLPGK